MLLMVQGSVSDEFCCIYAEDMVGLECAKNCGMAKIFALPQIFRPWANLLDVFTEKRT